MSLGIESFATEGVGTKTFPGSNLSVNHHEFQIPTLPDFQTPALTDELSDPRKRSNTSQGAIAAIITFQVNIKYEMFTITDRDG